MNLTWLELIWLSAPFDDQRQSGPGSFDDVFGLFLLHSTDVMVVDWNEHVSALQSTVRRTPAKHLQTVHIVLLLMLHSTQRGCIFTELDSGRTYLNCPLAFAFQGFLYIFRRHRWWAITGHSRSLEITPFDIAFEILFTFYSNFGASLHRFWDIVDGSRGLSKNCEAVMRSSAHCHNQAWHRGMHELMRNSCLAVNYTGYGFKATESNW